MMEAAGLEHENGALPLGGDELPLPLPLPLDQADEEMPHTNGVHHEEDGLDDALDSASEGGVHGREERVVVSGGQGRSSGCPTRAWAPVPRHLASAA